MIQHGSKQKRGRGGEERKQSECHPEPRKYEKCIITAGRPSSVSMTTSGGVMLYKSADEKASAADGLGGSVRTCEKLLMGSGIQLLNVAKSAISPPSLLKVRPQK